MLQRDKKVLSKLYDIAKDVPYVYRAKICAAIFHKNTLISYGFHSADSVKLQRRFRKNPLAVYNHAEINAIHNALKRVPEELLRSCTIYVCRAKKTREKGSYTPALACPCKGCKSAVEYYGLKRLIYTVNGSLDNAVLITR